MATSKFLLTNQPILCSPPNLFITAKSIASARDCYRHATFFQRTVIMIGSETEDNNEQGGFSDADANVCFPSQSFDYHRHCGDHVYHYEYSASASSLALNSAAEMKVSKGEDYSFPVRLHYLLDVLLQDNLAHLACWQPHGRYDHNIFCAHHRIASF